MVKHWNYPENDDIVVTSLRGLAASNPALTLIPSEKVVFNKATAKSKVAIISGGGSGHEPLHAGFVGENLLDAAVAGSIFASPSTKQIMAAVKATADKDKGVIDVVKNYTGDVLHFGLVAERAKRDGYKVELVTVSDDVAVGRTQNEMVGRRGIAGTALVHKALGAASAQKDAKIEELAELGRSVNAALVTIGASLDRTTVPGRGGEDVEKTGENTAELGLGIHNEPGEKLKPIPNAVDLIDLMYKRLLDKNDKERHYVDFGADDEYVLLINNIGGTSSLELYALAHYAVSRVPLKKRPSRVYISDFVTSLSSPGFSITLLNLEKAGTKKYGKQQVLNFLDVPTNAPGWKPKIYDLGLWEHPAEEIKESPMEHALYPKSETKIDAAAFEKSLENAMHLLILKEPEITKYDTQVGDGDCGETLKAGAEGILEALKSDKSFKENLSDVVATVSAITEIVEDRMGGTSGGIYAIYLTSFAKNLQEAKSVDVKLVAQALHNALYDGLFKYTKARKGGRTLVDTLQPFVDTLVETGDVRKLVDAARASCDNTAKLQAKFGRASYVNEEEFEGGVPDPGAVGLLAIIEGFVGKN